MRTLPLSIKIVTRTEIHIVGRGLTGLKVGPSQENFQKTFKKMQVKPQPSFFTTP